MAKSRRKNDQSLSYVPGLLLWHPHMASSANEQAHLVRVSYYTSVVGSDEDVIAAQEKINSIVYHGGGHGWKVTPHIFKKPGHSEKTKNVDIAICIDALRHAFQDHIDQLYLYSGDGDYVPLVEEVMRQGKQVIVGAFSEGCSPALRRKADGFINLDGWGFLSE